MGELSDLTAQPVEIQIGDTTYKVSPLTLDDWSALDSWAESRWLADMKKRMEAFKDDPQIVAEIKKRVATIRKFDLQVEAASYLDYGEGAVKTLFFQLRRNHPDIKEDFVKQNFTSEQYSAIQSRLAGLGKEDEGKKEKAEG